MAHAPTFEKVHRHVLVGKGALHNGVDMNPSICLGLYLDPSKTLSPVIEMFYLTNQYGRQAGMHFHTHIPQIMPRKANPQSFFGSRTYSVGRALGFFEKPEKHQSDVFAGYISGRVESHVDGVRTSAAKIPVSVKSTWLQSLSGVNDPTPGGSLMPEKKQEQLIDAAKDGVGMLPYPNWGTLGGVISLIENGPTSAAAVKLTGELASQLTHIYRQAKLDGNPVAGEVLSYIKAQSLYLAAHVVHPQDVIGLGQEIQSLADQIEYLSFSLENVRILTVDIEKPPARYLTKNPYNFDHEFRVFGQLWGWSDNGGVADLEHLDQEALENFGFGKAPEEYRKYQALMPNNVREYQLRGEIRPGIHKETRSSYGPSGP